MTGIEIAVIGSSAVTLGDALLVAGTLAGAGAAISSGQQQAAAARYNAQVAENDAIAARQQSEFELKALRRRQQAALSMARSAAAGRGVTAEGSPLLAQSEIAAESELDALALQYAGSVAETRSRSQAAAERLSASAYRAAGYTSAGTSLLTGFSRVKLGRAEPKVPMPSGSPFTGTGGIY